MISEMIDLLSDFFDRRSRNIIIGCIGKIESHDLVTMRADVKPLLKYTAEGGILAQDFAVISKVPVLFLYAGGFYIRPEYQRGDLVWVTFATHGIQSGLMGLADPTDEGAFSRDSAAVVHGLTPTVWVPPIDITKPGLVIGHEGGASLMQITETGISIMGAVDVTGDVTVTGEVTAKSMTTPVNLSTHLHPTGVGPSGSPTPGT